jgi:hypothetical protein
MPALGWKADHACGQMTLMISALPSVSVPQLRSALEASWQADTAYLGVHEAGNPALGQCYPTSRVVQWFFPSFEIVSGRVNTGASVEAHYWNMDPAQDPPEHVDLTWQQFPAGAVVTDFAILDRDELNDSVPTVQRCKLLLERVLGRLALADPL